MRVGMMWMSDGKFKDFDLVEEVQKAANHYHTKYGTYPSLAWVNPSQKPEGNVLIAGVVVKASKEVVSGHIWIGETE